MKYIQSYYTDIGVKRKTNQDSLALLKADTDFGEVLFAVICDGMGGHQSGELASKTIIKRCERWFKIEFPALLYNGLGFEVLKANLSRLINECNRDLVRYGERHGIEMGSTMTAYLFVQNRYFAAHVGDSRCYEISKIGVQQLTEDHSMLADAVRKGKMTLEEAKKDRRKNILTECVGITNRINIAFYTGEVKTNCSYLLCTDGFWHKTTDYDFVRYLAAEQIEDNKMLRMHLNYLVEQVKLNGEKDNISAIGIIPV